LVGRNLTGTPFIQTATLEEVEMKALVWHGRNDVRCDTVPVVMHPHS
jgi:hypothetical protein